MSKQVTLVIKVAPEEMAAWRVASKDCGMSVPVWLRSVGNGMCERTASVSEEVGIVPRRGMATYPFTGLPRVVPTNGAEHPAAGITDVPDFDEPPPATLAPTVTKDLRDIADLEAELHGQAQRIVAQSEAFAPTDAEFEALLPTPLEMAVIMGHVLEEVPTPADGFLEEVDALLSRIEPRRCDFFQPPESPCTLPKGHRGVHLTIKESR
jgi:hypothetical protein